jgi:uncharacterized membrane protein YhaH (DUF805 family)
LGVFLLVTLGIAKGLEVWLGRGEIVVVAFIALLVPTLAITVRRLHDVNRSGWWSPLALLPLVWPVLSEFVAHPGARQPNRYGPPPPGSPDSGTVYRNGVRDVHVDRPPPPGGRRDETA